MRENGIFIGLGSNRGDRRRNLDAALTEIDRIPGTRVTGCAAVYETEPWGRKEQDWFLNTVAEIESDLAPERLLTACTAIEEKMNSEPKKDWGPRQIDIDLLFADNTVIRSARLELPHPRIADRRFVLVPLADVAPGFIHPVLHKPVSRLLTETADTCRIRKTGLRLRRDG